MKKAKEHRVNIAGSVRPELKKKVQEVAARERRTVSNLIELMLEEGVERREKDHDKRTTGRS